MLVWFGGRFGMLVCEEPLGELKRVLMRPEFRRYTTAEEVKEYVVLFRRAAIVKPAQTVSGSFTPELASSRCLRAATAGAGNSGRQEIAVGEASSRREAHPVPGFAEFRNALGPAGHTGESSRTPR